MCKNEQINAISNLGKLVIGEKAPIACTPRAILELLNRYSISIASSEIVIMGRGLTVGRPLAVLLSMRGSDATVTITHTKTLDVISHTKRADIIVAAIGSPHFLRAEVVKPGAIVLDIGITRTDSGLVGDVHPDVSEVASAISPMPGGVGPMTRAMLLSNVVDMALAKK